MGFDYPELLLKPRVAAQHASRVQANPRATIAAAWILVALTSPRVSSAFWRRTKRLAFRTAEATPDFAGDCTLTSSGSVRLAHWRARHHDVSAELYAWLNREYARLGPYRRGREGEREQHALTRRAALPLRSAD